MTNPVTRLPSSEIISVKDQLLQCMQRLTLKNVLKASSSLHHHQTSKVKQTVLEVEELGALQDELYVLMAQ